MTFGGAMAKDTLIDLVQDILSDADGDEVNSISDTIESMQCARVVQNEFKNITDEFDIKMQETLVQLTATSGDTPCQMIRPEGYHSIETIWYDTRLLDGDDPRMEEIRFQDPEAFLEASFALNESATETGTMTLGESGFTIQFRNERAPSRYTILEGYDDIIFNAYDGDLETNLQASKSLVKGVARPSLALTDLAVPDLPQNLMQLLKNRSKSYYFDIYKDGAPSAVLRRERYSEVRSQRKKYITKKLQQQRTGPSYGRK
jgi:hypothetical protein